MVLFQNFKYFRLLSLLLVFDGQIEFDDRGIYIKTAVEKLNQLIAKLNEMNRGKKHLIILVDEVIIDHDCIDFSGLRLHYPFITIIIAINPAGYYLTKEVVIKPPSRKNILAIQLKSKHRNSYQIAVLIAHINKFYQDNVGAYKCLGTDNDKPLDPSNLPIGPLPIWLQRSPEMTDEQVLEYLKDNFLQEASNVTLVYNTDIPFSSDAELWLEKERWKVVNFYDMTGSETEVLVAFSEDFYANMELFSRARKQLIIVTK